MSVISTASGQLDFIRYFEKFIADSRSGRRLQPNGKRISQGTIGNYEITLGHLQRFSVAKEFPLRLHPVKRLQKRQLAAERNYWNRFYKKFTDYLYHDCKNFDNAVGQQIKIIRTFFGYLKKNLLLDTGDFHKNFFVRKEDIPIVTILPEELNFFIYDKPFEQSLPRHLQRVKDYFVFGCTVALRFSDLTKLKKTNLREVNGQVYLVVRSIKTATDTQVQLPDYAVAIINKYTRQKGGFLLPRYNLGRLNQYVKQLCEKAGLTQPAIKNRTLRGDTKIIKGRQQAAQRFCDLVTTHTMRRSAITIMLSLGMPEHIVRKISGHSPMSKEFFRYVALAQSYQDKETALHFQKLKEKQLLAKTG
jgi:integrase